MAGRKLDDSSERRQRQTLTFGFVIVGLLIIGGDASGQPMAHESVQWKQSIERPSRGWDYDGKRILGQIGHDVCLWDATTGELLHRLKEHKEPIHKVQFSPDGEHALSNSWRRPGPMLPYISKDTRTILWHLATGAKTHGFPGQVAGEFSSDGKRIVSFAQRPDTGKPDPAWGEAKDPSTGEVWQFGSAAKFDAAVWEVFGGHQLVKVKLDERSDPYRDALHFSPDGRRFVHLVHGAFLPYNSGGGVLFNASDGREIGRVTGDEVKFGKGRRYTLNGALAFFEPERARLFDLNSGQVVQNIQHDLKSIWGAVWTHDGSKVIAIPYRGGELKILDMKSKETMAGPTTPPQRPGMAIVSPDNRRLAIAWGGTDDVDPRFGLYDMNTGAEIAIIQFTKLGGLVGFSPDSKTLLVGGSAYDEYISENEKRTILPQFVIYNSENGKKIRALKLSTKSTHTTGQDRHSRLR